MLRKKKKRAAKALTALAESINLDRDRLAILRKLSEQLKTERSLLLTVLEHLPCGVIITSAANGNLILGNHTAEQIWRLPLGKLGSISDYRDWKAFHLDGRPYQADDWPLARAIRYGEEVRAEVLSIQHGDGTVAYVVSNAAPLRDYKGQIIAGMMAMMEIPKPAKNKRAHAGEKLPALAAFRAA